MRILVSAIGTRGDVQPAVALGLALREIGYGVRLAVSENLSPLVTPHDLECRPIRANYHELIAQRRRSRDADRKDRYESIRRFYWQLAQDLWDACQNTDAIVTETAMFPFLQPIAERLAVPVLSMCVYPVTPTRVFPPVRMPPLPHWAPFKGLYNRLWHWVLGRGFERFFRPTTNQLCNEILGRRPPAPGQLMRVWRNTPILYSFSRYLVERPFDWGDHAHVTGYWFSDSGELSKETQSALTDFLESGDPAIYIGFGSMAGRDPELFTEVVLGALAQSGFRAVLASGWGAIKGRNLPENLFLVDAVPHTWLFPRVAAVVHHGGSGTTTAGLLAGKPTAIVPFGGDQPFWGRRVAQLVAGPAPIPPKELTSANLSAAIRAVMTDQTMQSNAARLGEKIRTENGAVEAAEIIRGYVGRP